MGYSGGSKENPTYHDLGDHTETVQIDYDPTQISYEELLDVFWKSHNPKYQSWSRQYMVAVFYHDEEQKRCAEESKRRIEEAFGIVVQTTILPVSTFYRAEDYHQKYGVRKYGQFVQEYGRMYPHGDDFVDSTAVARVNGYVSGYGTPEELEDEIDDLGLSAEARRTLSILVSGRKGLDQ